jgi:hypothetical protein
VTTQIVAVLKAHKTTPNKVQFRETDQTDGLVQTLYLPKHAVRTMLGDADTITVLVEAGDQRKAS